jgi:hypothetical protein
MEHGFSRFSLVCDVEGKEYDQSRTKPRFSSEQDAIIMETHARLIRDEKNVFMRNKLKNLGFKIIDQDASVLTLRRLAR